MFHNTFDELITIGDRHRESESHYSISPLLPRMQVLFSKSTFNLVKRPVSIAKDICSPP